MHTRGTFRGPKSRTLIVGGLIGLVALATAAVGVVQNPSWGESDQVVVCHATGSATQPYVRLVVDRNGFEHGHHRHHAEDFFKNDTSALCEDDAVTAPPAEPPANETTPPVEEPAPSNETEPEATPEEPASNETEEEPVANETLPPPPPPRPDVSVTQTVTQNAESVFVRLEVRSIGDANASNTHLSDALPDMRRPWLLAGDDSARCTLEENVLSCAFGTLAPGESRVVELSAYTDRMPCGNHLTNTAQVYADADVDATNDRSSGGITARAC